MENTQMRDYNICDYNCIAFDKIVVYSSVAILVKIVKATSDSLHKSQ